MSHSVLLARGVQGGNAGTVTCEDESHIKGSRVTVQFIRERVEGRGLEPATVAEQHGLDLADVYLALAYYHDHPEEMQAVEAERERLHETAREDPNVTTAPQAEPLLDNDERSHGSENS